MASKNQQRTEPSTAGLPRMNKREARVLSDNAVQCVTVVYDFDEDGGAQGDIALTTRLPADSYVTAVYADRQTAFTSAGSTAEVKLKIGAADLTVAEAAPTAWTDATNTLTLADPTKFSDADEITMNIGVEDLTAGKARFAIYFHTSK